MDVFFGKSKNLRERRGEDVQDVKGELSRVECEFESDWFADASVQTAHLE